MEEKSFFFSSKKEWQHHCHLITFLKVKFFTTVKEIQGEKIEITRELLS